MKKFLAIFAVVALVAFAAPALAEANPFMDVPAGHWAYDAMEQLASRGVASGYPDGSYKGAQPATRYEMASMIARVLANVDMEKASKQDVELLKRLVLEFKNELDALGVKVNDLDKRVAVLEDGIGGWHIRGIFRFEANFSDGDFDNNSYTEAGKKNEFTKERFRLFLTKTIDENTYFYAQYRTGGANGSSGGRGDQAGGKWVDLYVDTKLPWGMDFRAGRFVVDFEDDYGLYIDNDAIFGDYRVDGVMLSKSFGALGVTAVVGRNAGMFDSIATTVGGIDYTSSDKKIANKKYDGMGDYMNYILDLHFQPSEKFFVGGSAYWGTEDSYGASIASVYGDSSKVNADIDVNTYGVYAGFNFTPNIALKGIYYFQDLGNDVWHNAKNITVATPAWDDSPNAWKAILDIKQAALKFTSLWIEYSEQDNSFIGYNDRYAIGGTNYANINENLPLNNETTKMLFVYAKQQWNDKFSTFARYTQTDFDTAGLDDAKQWGVGVGYQYTPAIYFELAYDSTDYGDGNMRSWQPGTNALATENPFLDGKDNVVRFRTTVTF